MTGFDFLRWMRDYKSIPWSREKKPPDGARPSNSELLRWLNSGAVKVEGQKLGRDSVVTFPVRLVEFFSGRALVSSGGFEE